MRRGKRKKEEKKEKKAKRRMQRSDDRYGGWVGRSEGKEKERRHTGFFNDLIFSMKLKVWK